jgi:hypothetical protein
MLGQANISQTDTYLNAGRFALQASPVGSVLAISNAAASPAEIGTCRDWPVFLAPSSMAAED